MIGSGGSGKGTQRLDAENYRRLKLDGGRTMRLQPVALNETIAELDGAQTETETVLLIPSSNFDATPYNNVVQAILYRNSALQAATLDCYGSALTYLTEGIVSYCQLHRPTAEQLALFVESIREQLHAYIICPKSNLFEPSVHPLSAFMANLFQFSTVYGSDTMSWKRLSMNDIGETVKNQGLANSQVWIDSHNSERYTKQMLQQFKKWGVSSQHIACNQLPHTSTSFPERFALVTIAPNKQKIKMLAKWSLRWQDAAKQGS